MTTAFALLFVKIVCLTLAVGFTPMIVRGVIRGPEVPSRIVTAWACSITLVVSCQWFWFW